MADKNQRKNEETSQTLFARNYSKAIADALLAKQQQLQQPTSSREQRLHDTYCALCYDEPHVDSDDNCFLLAASLTAAKSNKNEELALSERLVDGIRQGTAKYLSNVNNESKLATTTTRNEDESAVASATIANDTLQLQTSATPAGFASCAVAAFLHVPLHCCLASSKAEVEGWLGSYRGPRTELWVVDDDEGEQQQQLLLKSLTLKNMEEAIEKSNQTTQPQDDNNISIPPHSDEVWALESDPSDFVYESEAIDWTAWDDPSFNPKKLSQPVSGHWDELGNSVGNLIQELSFAKLAPLSQSQWKTLKVSDLLTQLTVTLLVQQPNCPLMENDRLRAFGIRPLHVLQDGILSGRKDLIPDYLSLVQSLIAFDASSNPNESTILAPASAVALTSLSKFSGHAKSLKETRKVRKCILECCEDFGILMARTKYSDYKVIWALLPLLDVISNRTMDGSCLDPAFNDEFANADAQWLLNSGFFRELIMLYCKSPDDDTSPANSLARKSLLQSIQILCLESITLLGKYAWRVPEWSKTIHNDKFRKCHNLDAIVWNLMGVHLANTNTAGSMLRMKQTSTTTTTTTPVIVTVESCRQVYRDGLEHLRTSVISSIDAIRQLRETTTKNTSSLWKDPILDFQRFTNLLQSCPSLSLIWKSEKQESNYGNSNIHSTTWMDDWLVPIRLSLSTVPAPPAAVVVEPPTTTIKSADNDKAGIPFSSDEQRPLTTYEDYLAMVRKSIKILVLSLQEDTRVSLSSKTD